MDRITITQAKDLYLGKYKARIGKIGRFGRTAQSYNTVSDEMTRAIVPLADKNICTLTKTQIEEFCEHWMGSGLAPRTAWNRVSSLKTLLDWAADATEVPCFAMPKGVTDLWRQCRPSGTTKVTPFDGDALEKLLKVANDNVKLYCLLALNCGMYQEDINNLRPENLKGDTLVWSRSKTAHQSEIVMTHKLWPETKALIEKCRSHQNAFGRLFVNRSGTPLVERQAGRRDRDAISTAWTRACADAGVRISIKDLRKWGATAIARIADMDTQRLYRGETIKGSSKDYVDLPFEARLSPALDKWHQELQTLLDKIA